MSDSFDVIVVGVGAMGSSTCFELARRGAKVLGIEQFDVPNTLGSSHGQSRMIRLSYYEHPDYVPLLKRAYERWDELERLSGEKLLHLTGGLYMGPGGCEFVEGSLAAAREHRLEYELLDGAAIRSRFGVFDLPAGWVGMFERRAGFLLPEKVVETYARLARANGAQIHERERVLEWSEDEAGVRVKTDQEEYRAKRIIFTSGAWTDKLLTDLGVRLVVTRQVMSWFAAGGDGNVELGHLPVWGIERPGGGLYYGFPRWPGDKGMKIACHWPGESTDPDQVIRQPLAGDTDEMSTAVSRYLPGVCGEIIDSRVCLYTNSPDSHFIIDSHPRDSRVTFACGFSGHGFKFASVVGEVLADLALEGRTNLPVGFLGLGRFR